MPDDELLRLAETNKLHQPAVLDAQVKRLIADPAFRRLRRQFRRPVAANPQPGCHEARCEEIPRMECRN